MIIYVDIDDTICTYLGDRHYPDAVPIEDNINKINDLYDKGNTIVVIEHNLDVVKTADWIIDIGPEGGDGGGTIVATGTPEEVSEVKSSHTGMYLKNLLKIS